MRKWLVTLDRGDIGSLVQGPKGTRVRWIAPPQRAIQSRAASWSASAATMKSSS